MWNNIFSFLWLAVFFISCGGQQPDISKERGLDDIRNAPKIEHSRLDKEPVHAKLKTDTTKVPILTFEESEIDFGTIDEGDEIEHTFKFTNTGKGPLSITNAKGSCGCTIPEWPMEPINPGETGEIKVKFNSTGKRGEQKKPVTITANTYPDNSTVIYLKGKVTPQKNDTGR